MPSLISTSTEIEAPAPVAPLVLLALPPVLLTVALLCVLIAAAAGRDPIWYEPLVTLPEAIALRDGGMALRLIRDGHDPNRPAAVRPGILGSDGSVMTPVAAAVDARRIEMVSLLEANGARVDEQTRRAVRCIQSRTDCDAVGADGP